MRSFIGRFIYSYFLSDDLPLEARNFNLMATSSVFAISMAIITNMFYLPPTLSQMAIYLTMDLFVIAMLYMANKLGKYVLASTIMLSVTVFVFTPLLYFYTGGVESGITSYLVMVVTFIFFMITGKACVVLAMAELAVICACLYAEYRRPELIRNAIYVQRVMLMDNGLAIMVASFFIGVAVKFQTYLYARERRKAEAASRAKSEFLAMMSHEIRTPLNAIIGLSEIQIQNKLPPETHADIEKIYNSGTSLLGIINDILDISKIETGSLELMPVRYETPSLINDVVQLNIVRVGSKQVIFELHIEPTVPSALIGDDMRVRQILNNLLSNAFKYTEQGHVSLRVMWRREAGKALMTFIVSDTGVGIKHADMRKIFSKYTQLDGRANRRIEGTGLGLSITKQLIGMMGGSISVESVYLQGSTFTVKLPQAIADDAPIGDDVALELESLRFVNGKSRDRGKRLMRSYMPYGKVLVVDDVTTNLDVARGFLMPYGLKVDCVHSGREAIDAIRGEATIYDLVLMDHMMPEMDGVEAVGIIRNEIGTEYARTVPIAALTANAVKGSEEMFLAKGFNAFIPKPIDIMRLDAVLSGWVRDRQSEETLRRAEASVPGRTDDDVRAERILAEFAPEGVDVITGIQRYGSASVYLKILSSFARHSPEIVRSVTNVSPDNLADYAVAIHGLKGAAYGICADAVGNRASFLELAAKRGEFDNVDASNYDFIVMVQKLLSALEPILRLRAEGGKRTVAPCPDPAVLGRMLDAVRKFDMSEMEKVMSELEALDYENDAELVVWLRDQVENLNYDVIEERLAAREEPEA
jgi:signal transduction histidine kinase/AmiR/NasT family two-component response regulator